MISSNFPPQHGKNVILSESSDPWYNSDIVYTEDATALIDLDQNITLCTKHDKKEDELAVKMHLIKKSCKRIMMLIIIIAVIVGLSKLYSKD